MDEKQIETLGAQVASSSDALTATKLLDDVQPCDREAVLVSAVKQANDFGAANLSSGRFEIIPSENGNIRTDQVVVREANFFGPDQVTPFLSIQVPLDCKK